MHQVQNKGKVRNKVGSEKCSFKYSQRTIHVWTSLFCSIYWI